MGSFLYQPSCVEIFETTLARSLWWRFYYH